MNIIHTKIFYSKVLAFARETIKASADRALADSTRSINEGSLGTIRYYLSDYQERKFDKKLITLEQAQAIALERMEKSVKEKTERVLAMLATASGSPELPAAIRIDIEWRKSHTWGMLPSAEVDAGGCHTADRLTSGCGFDKESTVTAKCFNANPAFARVVAICAYLDSLENTRTYGYYFDYCGARFEGAVGFDSHRSILERAGYALTGDFHSNIADCYRFSLK